MPWERLYSALLASDVLDVCGHAGHKLNARGRKILEYLRERRGRLFDEPRLSARGR
jgi:hypothetical protein